MYYWLFGILFIGFIIMILFIVALIFILDGSSSSSRSCDDECEYNGPIPEPQPGEIIGGASNTTLYSSMSKYVSPCFVYYGNNVTFNKTRYGIELPIGIYNIYVKYLAPKAVNNSELADKLVQTIQPPNFPNVIVQEQISFKTAKFVDNIATTMHFGIEMPPGGNILRLESALSVFGSKLEVERIEILFQQLL